MRSWLRDESKRRALRAVALYDPALTALVVAASLLTALLEGIGLGFLLPILTQGSGVDVTGRGGSDLLAFFQSAYASVGVPFTLETLLLGVAAVMTVRHAASVIGVWFQSILASRYVADLRNEMLQGILRARLPYLDDRGSSTLLNAIVTESNHAVHLVRNVVELLNSVLLALAYLAVSTYVAPRFTVLAVVTLAGLAALIRLVLEPAYAAGDRLSAANDAIQQWAQASVLGARTVKSFDLYERVSRQFEGATDEYRDARVALSRNRAILSETYALASALVVFGLVYLALGVAPLSLGATAVLLFAMLRLAPTAKRVSDLAYAVDGQLPHLVAVQDHLRELDGVREPDEGSASPPDSIHRISFDDVTFAYDDGTRVLDGVSLSASRGELVALVGPSGGGKSTLVSLLCRFYDPDDGAVLADGDPITTFDLREWRSAVALVRQDPFLFDDTLRENVTLGNPSASVAEFERACERARVDEFVDGLPEGYDTRLGDDGVRLSGGQRQRVALARALVKDASVFVFDEATSDLDPRLDAEIGETVSVLAEEAVTFVVAHRRSTIRDADRIYSLSDGQIEEVDASEAPPSGDGD